MLQIVTKVCSKCEEEKDVREFKKIRRNKSGIGSQCKSCINNQKSTWKSSNRERVIKHNRDYYAKNKHRILQQQRGSEKRVAYNKEYQATYIKEHPELKDKCNERQTKYREELTDWYIKLVLINGGLTSDIINNYHSLIKIKRLQLQTKRILKQQI